MPSPHFLTQIWQDSLFIQENAAAPMNNFDLLAYYLVIPILYPILFLFYPLLSQCAIHPICSKQNRKLLISQNLWWIVCTLHRPCFSSSHEKLDVLCIQQGATADLCIYSFNPIVTVKGKKLPANMEKIIKYVQFDVISAICHMTRAVYDDDDCCIKALKWKASKVC